MAPVNKPVTYGQVSQKEVELEASLVAPNPKDVEQPAAAVPMIELIAPATLMEGYELATQVGDEIITVVIPPGGVEKGQRFAVPLPASKGKTAAKKSAIPVGSWKDGLFDCFHYGLCHASCCLGWFCPLLAAGQVITRMELNWLGRPTSDVGSRTGAFRTLAIITTIYFATHMVLQSVINAMVADTNVYSSNTSTNAYSSSSGYGGGSTYQSSASSEPSGTLLLLNMIYSLMTWAYAILMIVVIYNVRSHVRSKYAIPESHKTCEGMEDFCCALWCSKCVSSQMLRHTGNYEENPAQCCTETGLFASPHLDDHCEDDLKVRHATIV